MGNELDGTNHKNDPLVVKPRSIDFGSLSHGQGAMVTLSVLGGPGNITFTSDHFKVTPTSFTPEGSDIEITLLCGSFGELIWDEIVLQTDAQEIRVPVTARWEVRELERPVDTAAEAPVIQRAEAKARPKDNRTFKGRACSRCGKNFAYDIDSMSWEECTCNWFQVLVNMGTYHIKELRLGIKYLSSAFRETWYVLFSKEK